VPLALGSGGLGGGLQIDCCPHHLLNDSPHLPGQADLCQREALQPRILAC
jgi:hypothetical protein